ncbi:hypothetical protein T484DRAFT_2597648 [Baffinella frigidus]|nr:hypothetical protein T484DRAFT_2597648 [Cryptophyta sp. CCMP2293]
MLDQQSGGRGRDAKVLGALASIRNHLQRTRTRLHEEQEDQRVTARVEPWTYAARGGPAGMDGKLALPASVYSLSNELRMRRSDAAWQKKVMRWMAWNSLHMKVRAHVAFPAALRHTAGSLGWTIAKVNSPLPRGQLWKKARNFVLSAIELTFDCSRSRLKLAPGCVAPARTLVGSTNPHNLGKSKKSKTPNPLGGRRNPTAFKGIFGAIFPDLPRL